MKTHNSFKLLAKEILCGLYLKDLDIMAWFPKFGTFKKGLLTNKEFFSAVEALDAILIFDKGAEALLQAYYDYLVARQQHSVGYSEPLLLIDQLNMMINKDTGNATRVKIIEDLLQSVAVHLTDQRLPLGDIITKYDTQKTGMLYKSEFTTQFLDNYLALTPTLQANGTL